MGIDFVSHQGAVDISAPVGKAKFTMMAAIGEFGRAPGVFFMPPAQSAKSCEKATVAAP
jgi:hypothetical protein